MGNVKLNNKKSILLKVSQTQTVKNVVIKLANEKLKEQKSLFLEEFQNHPVSREIKSKEGNESGTLPGVPNGNLFSFIGFNADDDPIGNVVKFFQSKIRIGRKVDFKVTGSDKITASVNFISPNVDEIENVTQAEWGAFSWLTRIERGISGLGYYISKMLSNPPSRSEQGIQVKTKVRSGQFRPVSYFSALYNKFLQSLGKDNKFK